MLRRADIGGWGINARKMSAKEATIVMACRIIRSSSEHYGIPWHFVGT